ncbi:ROK family transcriptional regulator [Pseudacidobacterium ailaaui]|uniref:ROK family transcriptional regulator n=1 Tax=Pseudacidobacterium ailaaui TaxID=1382359 RepID=UPI0005D1E9E8|nr:ROK family transcriptional regulator [Pseudacidobacterium ailaaui]
MRHVDLTSAELASSETARHINRDIILQLIRTRQPISRADLARISGLQRSTVSQIIEQLLEERWVREGALAHLPRGRRPTLVHLNDDLVVLAADIHPRQATVALVDLNGRLLSRSTLPIGTNPAKALHAITECMKRICDAHPKKSIEGIGVSLPGRVDPKTQRLVFAPNLHWPDFDIKGTIEREMHLHTEMENAATACLLSELWFGRMDGIRDAVLITVSEGIGSGVMTNGQIVSGRNGMAGEFGHVPLDPSGPRCACNANGCWEMFASCNAALRYYSELDPRGKRITFHELLSLAEEGNTRAIDALSKQARYLGKGLRTVIAGLSPEVILVAGDVTSAWARFAPLVEAEIKYAVLAGHPPQLLPTHEGDVARLRGAAALLLQRHSVS